MKKSDLISYSLLALSAIILAFSAGPIAQKIKILYLSCSVRVDTRFESGSVKEVKLIDAQKVKSSTGKRTWQLTYTVIPQDDPINPVDSTAIPSNRWFYFCMTGVKNKQIQLLFYHTDPVRPVYSYDGCNYERFTASEAAFQKISKYFTRDTVYLAYYIPYTFSYLQDRISQWTTNSQIIQVDTIGWSAQQRPLQMLTITDTSVPVEQKQQIYIHARIHSGETPAEWFTDSMVDALVGDTPEAAKWRRQMVFYIVPCANPDGAANGLSRSNAQGIDLETNYQAPDSLTAPEVQAIRETIKRLSANRPLEMVLNLHSQTTPRAGFWIHTAASTSLSFFQQQMDFAFLHTDQNPYFSPDDLSFSDLPPYCLEGWIWEQYQNRTLALTFETPYTCYCGNPYGEWVNVSNLGLLSHHFLRALSKYTSSQTIGCEYPMGVQKLIAAYPVYLKGYQNGYLIFNDGTKMLYDDGLFACSYPKGTSAPPGRNHDPGRIRSEDFFKKIYGSTPQEVERHLTKIVWCPKTIGQTIWVTTMNNVDKQLIKISEQLDNHPEWAAYLESAGSYNWRTVAGTDKLSPHSFGIAIDLNTAHSDYWQWNHHTTDEQIPITYKNRIPLEMVAIFEKHGFIWGGKWYHYDTMHFEYRPELLVE